jgi:HK97 family phage prohead protease
MSAQFEIKTVDEAQRVISGYAAVIGTMDRGRDIIDQAAFTKTLQEKKPSDIAVFIAHKADTLPVGVPLVMRVDAKGLYTETKIAPGPSGDDLLATAKFLQEYGQPLGQSIGYYARKSTYEAGPDHKTVRRLLDIDLMEYSFASHQTIMHPDARVTGVKAMMRGQMGYQVEERDGKFAVVCLDGFQDVGVYDTRDMAETVLGALSKVTGEDPYLDSPALMGKAVRVMPYRIEKSGNEHCVINSQTGRKLGCHPTRKDAIQQLRAVYVSTEGKTIPSEAEVADLPDSAFLFVEKGEQDREGKTLPRSHRHFPIRGADGEVNEVQVALALAEIPGDEHLDSSQKARLTARARRLLESDVKTETPEWKEGAALESLALGYQLIALSQGIAHDQEAMRLLALDTKAGRAMGEAQLKSLHDLVMEVKQVHDASCGLGEDCPLKTDQQKVLTRYQLELDLLEV